MTDIDMADVSTDSPYYTKEYGWKWWSYREKFAWYDFIRDEPEKSAVIRNLIAKIDVSNSPDPWMNGQVEVLCLRVAWLLGLVEYDWRLYD